MAKFVQPIFDVYGVAQFNNQATFDTSIFIQSPTTSTDDTPYALLIEGTGADQIVKFRELGDMAWATASNYLTKSQIDTSMNLISVQLVLHETSLGQLNDWDTKQDASIVKLFTATTLHETSLGNLSVTSALHETSLGNLDTYVNNLESSVGVLDVSIGQLDDAIQNLDTSLDLYLPLAGGTLSGALTFASGGWILDSQTITAIDASSEGLGVGSDGALPTSAAVKSYVDKQIVSTVTAWNGLTETDNSIGLGGELVQNTTIDVSDYTLTISSDAGDWTLAKAEFMPEQITITVDDVSTGGGVSYADVVANKVELYSDDGGSHYTQLRMYDDGHGTLDFTDYFTVTDASEHGIVYGGDYESTFVARSLVTKQYVTSQISASTPNVANGLSIQLDSSIGLGGPLNKATTITTTDTSTLAIAGLQTGTTRLAVISDSGVLKTEQLGTMALATATDYDTKTEIDASFALYDTKLDIDTSFGLYLTSAQVATTYETKANVDTSLALYDTKLEIDSSFALYLTSAQVATTYETKANVDASLLLYDTKLEIDSSFALYTTTTALSTTYETKANVDTSLALYVPASGGTFSGLVTLDSSAIFNGISVFKDKVYFDGSVFFTDVETIDVSSAYIFLNTGLSGAPPANLQSGIIIGRGSSDPYAFVYDETTQTFRVGITDLSLGQYDDSSTQAVATRQDSPTANGVAYWNDNENRFDTDASITKTTAGLVLNNVPAQTNELTVLSLNGSNVVGQSELGTMALEASSNYDTKAQIDTSLALYVPATGGTFSGAITLSSGMSLDGQSITNVDTSAEGFGVGLDTHIPTSGLVKSAIDAAIAAGVTASSGLHEVTGDIRLGGILTGDTSIGLNGNKLSFPGLLDTANELTVLAVINDDNDLRYTTLGTMAFEASSGYLYKTQIDSSMSTISLKLNLHETSLGNLTQWNIKQDASIVKLFTATTLHETSLGNLTQWDIKQDASIVKLFTTTTNIDASAGNLTAWNKLQDSSITANWSRWVDSQRQGFVDNSETTISFNDVTGQFTLTDAGSGWSYYRNGSKYTIAGNKTVTLPGGGSATADTYFIYINANDGTLTASTTVWSTLSDQLPVSYIIFDSANSPKYHMGDERHTMLIDRQMHYYLHTTRGTQLVSGGTLTGPNVGATTDASNAIGIAATVIADEDLFLTLGALARPDDPGGADTNIYNVYFRTGASSWDWKLQDLPFPYQTSGFIQYDNGGTLTQGQSGKFYNAYLVYTDQPGGIGRFSWIPGRGEFNTLDDALGENVGTFDFSGLPFTEFVAGYQFTWEASAGLGTIGKVTLATSPVVVKANFTSASTPVTTAHNDLLGLQGGSGAERYHLSSSQYNDYIGKTDVDASLLTAWTELNLHEGSLGNLDTYVNNLEASVGILDTSVGQLDDAIQNLDSSLDLYLPLAGGSLSGLLTMASQGFALDSLTMTAIDSSAEGFGVGLDSHLPTSAAVKSAIDAAISAGVTASNGLHETGGDIQLGGVLTSDTSITINGANVLRLNGLTSGTTRLAVISDGGVLKTQQLGTMALNTATDYDTKTEIDASFALYDTKLDIDTSFGLYLTSAQVSTTYETKANVDTSLALYDTKLEIDSSFALYTTTTALSTTYETKANVDASLLLYDTKLEIDSSFALYDTKTQIDTSLALYVPATGGTFTGDLYLSGGTTNFVIDGSSVFNGEVIFKDKVFFDGSVYFTDVETIDVSSAYIFLNTGLSGAPPANLQSGIIVGRGSADPYAFIYDETTQTFRIGITDLSLGQYDDASTQAVATREDNPTDNGIGFWNEVADRIDTASGFTFVSNAMNIDGSISTNGLLLGTGLGTSGSELTALFTLPTTGEVVTRDLSSPAFTTPADLTVTGPLNIGSGSGTAAVLTALGLTIDQANGSTAGYLTSTDWNTFNGKLDNAANISAGGTASIYSYRDASVAYFKQIVQGTGATITEDASTITIAVAGAAGYVSKYLGSFTPSDGSIWITAGTHGLGTDGPFTVAVYEGGSELVHTGVEYNTGGDINLLWIPGSIVSDCSVMISG